jgi:hypothetical protein
MGVGDANSSIGGRELPVLAGLTRVPVHGRPLPGNLEADSKCLLVAAC